MPIHTTFYIFDKQIWKKAQLLADAQGVTRTKMLWKALTVYLEDKCPLGTMDAFINSSSPIIRVDTILDKNKNLIKQKIKQFSVTDIDKQQDWAKLYLTCLNEERMKRFEK